MKERGVYEKFREQWEAYSALSFCRVLRRSNIFVFSMKGKR